MWALQFIRKAEFLVFLWEERGCIATITELGDIDNLDKTYPEEWEEFLKNE
jgi:hypothetical protein